MSLPEALERAAQALPDQADAIRPANGDPSQLVSAMDADGSSRLLLWLLTHEPEDGEELLLAWGDDERGSQRVQAIDASQLPKAGKKLLRKALHRMRTSGVDVAVTRTASPAVARVGRVEDEIAGAYMTPVDPRGSVLLFLVEGNPAGGARLFQVLLDERRGVVEFDVYATGRSKTRNFLRKLTDAAPTGTAGAVPIDGAIARGLIRRIAAGHPSDRPYPRPFSEWRRKLESAAGDETPGDATRRAFGEAQRATSQEISQAREQRVADRVRAAEIGPWPSETSRLTELSTQLGAAVDELVAMRGDARSEALEAALAAATAQLFEADHAEHTASRFELSAYAASMAAQQDRAADFLAAADVFRAGNLANNRIARAMTETLTATILKRAEEPHPATDAAATVPAEAAPAGS